MSIRRLVIEVGSLCKREDRHGVWEVVELCKCPKLFDCHYVGMGTLFLQLGDKSPHPALNTYSAIPAITPCT